MAYSMKQLQAITGKPPQTINRLMRRNESLIALLPEHRIQQSNKQVFYDDVILDWLKEYFQLDKKEVVEDGEEGAITEDKPPEVPKHSPPASTNDALIDELRRQVDDLEEQIERKDKVIADLEQQLKDKEAERLHFVSQNGQLMALLVAEKQEKQRLLPPPKATFGEKVRGLFGRKKENKKDLESEGGIVE